MDISTTLKGAFIESLKRNNKQIRDDRATAIGEDAELVYKRMIEDLTMSIRKYKREQESMLDLSPSDKNTLVLASDFDAQRWAEKDTDLALKIRNTEIKLELAQNRYNHLFGGAE